MEELSKILKKKDRSISLKFRNEKNKLVPCDDFTSDFIQGLKKNEVIEMNPKKTKRNSLAWRKFMKMFRVALIEGYTAKTLISEVMIKAGYYDPISLSSGDEEINVRIPYSLAFDSLDDERLFGKIFSDCREVLNKEYGHKFPDDLLDSFF